MPQFLTNVLPRAVARYTPETYSQLATAIQKNQLGVSDRAGLVGKPGGSWMATDVGKIVQLWPWLPVITGYFYGIIHSINGVISTYN